MSASTSASSRSKMDFGLTSLSYTFKNIFLFFFDRLNLVKRATLALQPKNTELHRRVLKDEFLGKYIRSVYSAESLQNKRFYNIGAGNQRSAHNFWSYVDMEESKYSKAQIDVFYNLESLEPFPIPEDSAEVIFNSFVIEHISIEATKNLCREAYRCLKTGGVFHSKVHCYEYAHRLLRHGIISPKLPFECRETIALLDDFILRSKGKVTAGFDEDGAYVLQGDGLEPLRLGSAETFAYHNATSALANLSQEGGDLSRTLQSLPSDDLVSFYAGLQKYVDTDLKEPHQHNADYFPKEELFDYIKGLGFSEVYFTQPYQSVSPALWEDILNPIHRGFIFSIEAIK